MGSGTWVKLTPGATGRLQRRKDLNPAFKGWKEEVGLAMGVGRPGGGDRAGEGAVRDISGRWSGGEEAVGGCFWRWR